MGISILNKTSKPDVTKQEKPVVKPTVKPKPKPKLKPKKKTNLSAKPKKKNPVGRPKKIIKSENGEPIPMITCQECGKPKLKEDFYADSKTETGTMPFCKKCLIKRALDPGMNILTKEGLISVLRMLDKPYINSLWLKVRSQTVQEEKKLGNYLKLMATPYHRNRKFTDSDPEINDDEYFHQLSDEKKYSATWRGDYSEKELNVLNTLYEGYKNSFNITNTSQEDYARKIAKASLYYDKVFEDFQNGSCAESKFKAAKEAFDTLSKSAKFAESERTSNNGNTCFGQIFDEVEKNTWIPKYVPESDDVYDTLIKQLSNIERSL